jgi:hypothetical protein
VDLGPEPTNRFDPHSLWWRHERLHRTALGDLTASVARFGPERDRTERAWLADRPASTEAFARADQLEARWTAELDAAGLVDRRPRWVRTQWQRFDRAAELASAVPTP